MRQFAFTPIQFRIPECVPREQRRSLPYRVTTELESTVDRPAIALPTGT